jgi:Flp pilus assembly pilin Flp
MNSSNRFHASRRAILRRRARNQLGATLVEYAFLITFVAIPAIAGFTLGGLIMLRTYRHTRNHLMLPTP